TLGELRGDAGARPRTDDRLTGLDLRTEPGETLGIGYEWHWIGSRGEWLGARRHTRSTGLPSGMSSSIRAATASATAGSLMCASTAPTATGGPTLERSVSKSAWSAAGS